MLTVRQKDNHKESRSKGDNFMIPEKMSIKSMFKTKRALLESKLSVLLEHPITKGDHCESAWIDFFRSFLPSKYSVDKGFVFDSKGNVSDQIDIIIHDALYSPLIFSTDAGEKFITAESVYAIFDSKPKIDKATLEYTSNKIASVVRLERSSRGIINAGKYDDPRKLTPVIGGILAIDAVSNAAIEKHLSDARHIDIGCAIKQTSFITERDAQGNISIINFSDEDESIISFFYIILDSLYKLGTVAGIDIRDYSDATVGSLKLSRGPL